MPYFPPTLTFPAGRPFRWRLAGGLVLLLGIGGCEPPISRTREGQRNASGIYRIYCSGCHGLDGRKGDARRHLASLAGTPSGDIERIISIGRGRAMPAFRTRLKPDEIAAVADYVKQIGSSSRKRPSS